MRLKSNHYIPDIIRAMSFRLREEDGDTVRAELGVDPEDRAILSMSNAEGSSFFQATTEVSGAEMTAHLFLAYTETIDPEDSNDDAGEGKDHVAVHNGEMLIDLFEGDNLLWWPGPKDGLKWPDYDESGDRVKSIQRKETLMSAEDLNRDSGNLYSKLFQLVDDSENVRARLALEDGSPALTMYDRGGIGRIRIGMLFGNPGVYVADRDGNVRIGITTMDSGETGLFVYDQDGWLVYSISVNADGDVGETFG